MRTLPDPCVLAPANLTAPALGVKVAPKGRLSETTVDRVTQDKCAWRHANMTLFVAVTPYQASGGSGGVTGMVFERRPAGLGPQGWFVYGRNLKCLFSDASFAKAGHSVTLHSHGPDSPGSVLAPREPSARRCPDPDQCGPFDGCVWASTMPAQGAKRRPPGRCAAGQRKSVQTRRDRDSRDAETLHQEDLRLT